MYKTTTTQKNKCSLAMTNANKRMHELIVEIRELESKMESLNAEYAKWNKIGCLASNMRNGVVEFNAKLLNV